MYAKKHIHMFGYTLKKAPKEGKITFAKLSDFYPLWLNTKGGSL